MFRDFSEDAKQKLLGYVDDVTETRTWAKIKDGIGDIGLHVQNWCGYLNITRFINHMDAYHKKVLDKNNTTKAKIEEIFANVKEIDTRYGAGVSGEVSAANSIQNFINTLAASIDPNGGNLDMKKVKSALSASLQALQESKATKEKVIEEQMLGTDPEGASKSVDPVNLCTGNFIYDFEDLKIEGEVPLSFHRYYNSKDTRITTLGKCFRHGYEVKLLIDENGNADITMADGQHKRFAMDETGHYFAENVICEYLEKEEEIYIYKSSDKKIFFFKANGELSRVEDFYGKGISLSYTDGLLTAVHNDAGDFLHLEYTNAGYISKVFDHTGRKIFFTYEDILLKSVCLSDGRTISYEYGMNGRITEIINSHNVVSVQNEYDNQFRVVRQQFPDHGTMEFEYKDDQKSVVQTERNGSKTIFVHDDKYRNTMIIYEDGTKEQFVYNEKNQCIKKIDRKGNVRRMAYDNHGNLTQTVDAKKQRMNMTYDAQNRLLNVSLNGKERVKNVYDSAGNLIYTENAIGKTETMSYDDKGRLKKVLHEDGFWQEFVYDSKGNIIKITDQSGSTGTYSYDALNRVTEVWDANGNKTQYEYDVNNKIRNIVNPQGNQRTYTYTSNGKVESVVDYDGKTVSMEYDDSGRVVCECDKEGNQYHYGYDKMWNMTSVTAPNGGVRKYHYNQKNHMDEMVMPNGKKRQMVYDVLGNCTKIIEPDGTQVFLEYDAENRITSLVDGNGVKTRYEYDIDGNLVKIIDAMNYEIAFAYDAMGNRISYTDEKGNQTRMEYTPGGQVKKMIYPNGGETVYTYEPGGRLKSVKEPNGAYEEYQYDGNGNVVRKINGLGEVQSMKYDCLNQLIEVQNPAGGCCHFSYDVLGNMVKAVNEIGAVTRYEYTLNGEIHKVIDANGNETCYEYDSMGQVCKITRSDGEEVQTTDIEWDLAGNVTKVRNPLGDIEQYFYDSCGQLLSMIDQDGYKTQYQYDGVGQIKEVIYDDNRKVSFYYNPLRQLTEMNDWIGTTKLELDASGLPLSVLDPYGKEVKYEWGSMGEKTKMVYPNGESVSYTYNEGNQLIQVHGAFGSVNYEYDTMGRFVARSMPNGLKHVYSYNELGRIKEVKNISGQETIESYQYMYDLAGNKIQTMKKRTNLEQENGTYDYSYDALQRLVSVTKNGQMQKKYQYDAFGNRLSKQDFTTDAVTRYAYNKNNQLLRESSIGLEKTYEYDRRGNLSKVMENSKILQTFAFDSTNRLCEAKSFQVENEVSATYQYNGLGQRLEQNCQYRHMNKATEWNHVQYTLDLTRKYHNMLSRTEVGNQKQQWFYYDGKVFGMKEKNQNAYYMQDDHGTPTALVDDYCETLGTYSYDEFGLPRVTEGRWNQPFGYTGYQMDSVNNLYFAQARQYNPQNGRFVSQDIVRGVLSDTVTLNRYVYCWNRPEDYEDNDGEWPTVVVGAVVGGLVSAAVEAGSQVVKGMKSGKSFKESVKSIDGKRVLLEAGKGAVKGAIAGTGVGVSPVFSAVADGLVDGAGNVVEQVWVDGKSIKEVNWLETVVTTAASVVTSLTINKASEKISKSIGKKFGWDSTLNEANGKSVITDIESRNRARHVIKDQINRATSKSSVAKYTGRYLKVTKQYYKAIAEYAGLSYIKEAMGKVEETLYKEKMNGWIKEKVDERWYCHIAA